MLDANEMIAMIAAALTPRVTGAVAEPDESRAAALLRAALRDALAEAYLEGVRRYAWWKDGEAMVGSTGKTLRQATLDIQRELRGADAAAPDGASR